MELLIFAHRGEAQSFISGLSAKIHETNQNLYLAQDAIILITGEGVYNVFKSLGPVLGAYKVSKIINFGIAGGLQHKDLEINTIYSIRTCYGYEANSPLFHSHTSNDKKTHLDCVTCWNRVLEDELANKLKAYAPIVDRELWAIGSLASELNIHFFSYKLISDYAGSQTNCFDIRDHAKSFSDQLFNYYQNLELAKENPFPTKDSYKFHTSFTQKKHIEKLSKKINQETFQQALNDANDAQELIIKLEDILNPLNPQIRKKIRSFQIPFEEIGAKLLFDQKLENKKIQLTMQINSQTNIKKLAELLTEFDYQKVEDFWNGNLDV